MTMRYGTDQAVEALLRSLPSEDILLRLKALIERNVRLDRIYAENQSQ